MVYSSPLFTTLHSDRKSPLHLCLRVPVGEFIDNSSVINYDQLYAQMMYELHDKFEYVWRVVKSCEEWITTLHLSQPQCLSGFPAKRWRVKSKNESKVFPGQSHAFRLLESIFRMAMVDLPKFFSRCITLRPAMAKSCPSRGQYCAIVRQKVEWGSFQLVRTIMTTSGRLSGTSKEPSTPIYIIDYTITFKISHKNEQIHSLQHYMPIGIM